MLHDGSDGIIFFKDIDRLYQFFLDFGWAFFVFMEVVPRFLVLSKF